MKMPCEVVIWYVLPSIRRELTHAMVKECKMSQAMVARRLGLTEAAISQYMKQKRGTLAIKDKKLKEEIRKSARLLCKDPSPERLNSEICRICDLVKKSSHWTEIYSEKEGKDIECKVCK